MHSKNHSKNNFVCDRVMCDSYLGTSCEKVEEKTGFVNSYEGKTSDKYVCKDCKKIPDQCKCYDYDEYDEYDEYGYDEYEYDDYEYGYDDHEYGYDERCDCGDCPECGIPRPHMIGLWGYNEAMIGRPFKK